MCLSLTPSLYLFLCVSVSLLPNNETYSLFVTQLETAFKLRSLSKQGEEERERKLLAVCVYIEHKQLPSYTYALLTYTLTHTHTWTNSFLTYVTRICQKIRNEDASGMSGLHTHTHMHTTITTRERVKLYMQLFFEL